MNDSAPLSPIEQFLHELNQTWLDGRYEDLYNFFHPEVVMLPPASRPVVGAKPMVDSYRQFGEMATIHAFSVDSVTLYEYPSVVMAHLRFSMDYEIPDGRYQDSGMDVYAIDSPTTKPQIVWRTQVT